MGTKPPKGKPFIGNLPLPKEVVRKPVRGANGRAEAAPPQTIDLTANTNTPGKVVTNRNPYWSKDEQFILFDSDRANINGTDVAADGKFHIYRMRPDGSGVTALTGPLSSPVIRANTSQTEASFNASSSAIIYIDTAADGSVDLREYNINTGVDRSLLRNVNGGFNDGVPPFTALNHPEYAFSVRDGIGAVFAGQVQGQPFHLYTVGLTTGQPTSGAVDQLTFGIADDRNPTLSPDPNKPLVAFDSNRNDPHGATIKSNRDVWAMGAGSDQSQGYPAVQVTNFAANGVASENIQPAWSTNKTDQPSGTQQIIRGQQLLAFATTRFDSNNDGNANTVDAAGRHEIYWLKVDITRAGSTFTIANPEGANGNSAFKLVSSDPGNKYDDLHPTWPQFISTYRVAYQTNRKSYNTITGVSGPPTTGNPPPSDIFASTLFDLNAPTLIRYDIGTGDIVSVVPRQAAPGTNVTISVKLADLETGVRDVWVQIKNPNSKYQSSDGVEHKVFLNAGLNVNNNTVAQGVPLEYEMQRIFIGNDPNDARVNSYDNPFYTASLDDFFAFSGSDHAPDVSWLQLQPDPNVPKDPVTGAITYKAVWKTGPFPTDYVIDVVAYDNALNPFTTGTQDQGSNWKIYDNIWGFSTQPFQASRNILFVSDYSSGQKFFSSRFGINSLVNVSQTFWGTESWLTDIDVNLLPTSYISGTTVGTILDARNTLGVNSYDDGLARDGTVVDGFPLNPTQTYDIWRVLCRGPVPDSVLQQYAPHTETQPPDTINGESAPRTVFVSPRCVVWNAPYTGNLFTGPGTLTDLATQIQLNSFVAAGGRLVVNGQDVAWALTLGGSAQSQFLTNVLKATFVTDDAGFTFFRIGGSAFSFGYGISGAYQLTAAGAYNPISNDPWLTPNKFLPSTHHIWRGPPFPDGVSDFLSTDPEFYVGGNDINNPRLWGSPGAQFPDVVQPIAPAISDFTYGGGVGTAVQHYEDPATHQRVVYMPMGAEGLFNDFYTPPGSQNTIAMKNRLMELMHNCVCWLRTGQVSGTVLDTEGGQPIAGVLVRLANRNDANGKPIIAYTAITANDGSFLINGVEPDTYEITAVKPGFTIQKRTFTTMHGGFRDQIAFRMTKAEPATIQGKITRLDGTTPVQGATITATDVLNPANTFTTTSQVDGTYSFDRIPALTKYTLTVVGPKDNDGNPLYGESIPASLTVEDPNDPSGNKLLQPATTYKPYDFKLKAIPGNVTGFVYADNNGAQGAPIAGATVTATCGNVTTTAITAADGSYSFNVANNPANGLDPGLCVLVASAPGYAKSAGTNVTVTSGGNTVAAPILLKAVPPGSLSGLVTRTSDNAPLTGVTIELRDANGTLVATTKTVAAQTTNGYTYNYKFDSVPAGVTYTVTAALSGYTPNPTSKSAKVDSGVETKNVNFQMEPLHTFSAALSMVSTPYDYSTLPQNAAELLSVSPTDPAFLMATWDLGQYVYFPTPPADKFRLGRGYFLGYKTNLPLAKEGTTANPTQPFDISLAPGWNMIGDPFLVDIDWTKVSVVDGGVVKTFDQAVSSAAIGAGLYTYQSGTYILDFRLTPWRGYWVRAYRQVTLRIDPNSAKIGRAAAVQGANSRAVLRGADGWTLNLRANVGSLRDEDNQLGVSSRATNGFDGYKLEKPPVFGKEFVYLTFDHSDWAEHSGGYGVDVRSASTTTNTWEFSVQTNVPNSTATISWPNSASVGRATSLTLTDLATGEVRDLGSSSSYSWQTGEKPTARKFRIEATRNTISGALRITSLIARSSGRANSATNVSFNLSSAANVEVRVLGANGSAVRKLSSRATRAAGVNDVTWDQRNDKGTAVPAGAYTVEVKAISTDGKSSARQITTVIITR